MEQVGGGERVVERAVGRLVREPEATRERAESLQFGTSSRTSRRASAHVSTDGFDIAADPHARRAASRNARSKRTLWPTITVPALNSTNAARTDSMRGAGSTIAWVMPVRTVISGGMGMPGFTSVWNVPRHSPPRSLTAPTSVIAHWAALAPVVSRSSTQNVTSESGVPRSSNVRCTARRYGEQAFESKNTCSILQRSQYDAARGGDPLPLHRVRQPHAVRRGHQPADECVPPLHSGGELTIEDEQVLDERIESVTCRWCGPAGAVQAMTTEEIADSA